MCMFPKICVIYQQTESLSSLLVVFVALDMRTSFLLFILTAAKHTFTGVYAGPSMPVSSTVRCEAPEPPKNAKTPDKLESRFRMQCIDGYVRKAGTSNLYRCEEKNHAYLWVNLPSLTCIPDPLKPIPTAGPTSTALTNTQAHTPAPNLTLSTSSAPVTTYYTTKGKTQSTSTTSGQTALTTTHTVPTTTGTFVHRTTTKEETTTNRNTLSSSSTLTIRENLTTVSPQFTHSSINTTTTEVDGESKAPVSDPTKNGIAAGTVLILIVAVASAVGVFLWCRRSRKRELNPAEEMISPAPSSDKPLLELATSTSFSDSVQNPDSLPTLIVQHA
ncbi:interleukin-15 receptor subunit alpha isoform X4 [Pygocentrus nattereri]|uniref:interleukin-15 receptor subunit alpha isoform X4 n=1 Tax=Pygocentrus nattereri TaxID=42514 RepID=UPI000814367E|nr:interleukin-15 receptor subunit alpha isoform X4 [Pygocentrus nattereri]